MIKRKPQIKMIRNALVENVSCFQCGNIYFFVLTGTERDARHALYA